MNAPPSESTAPTAAAGRGGSRPDRHDDSGVGPGRPRDPQVDTAIIDAAVELMRDGGAEALSMEAVANRASVSRASVYRRYANRVDLMEAVFHAVAAQKLNPPDTGSVRSDLVQLVQWLRTVLVDSDGGAMLPVMLGAAKESTEVREALERFTSARRAPTLEVIRRGVDRGEIRAEVDADLLADLLVGAVIYRVLMRNGTIDDAAAAALVDTVIEGAGS